MDVRGGKPKTLYVFKPFVMLKNERKCVTKEEKEAKVPYPRSGHRIVADDSYCYSFGGYHPTINSTHYDEIIVDGDGGGAVEGRSLFRELWRFNISTGIWENMKSFKNSMPKELASNGVVISGSTMLVHGGTGVPFGTACSNDTYISNLRSCRAFLRLSVSGTKPQELYGQAIALSGDYVYVVGGTTGFYYNLDVHQLDLKTKTWEVLYSSREQAALQLQTASMGRNIATRPEGRYRHEIALYEDKIYVFGGGTAEEVYSLETLAAFDLRTKQWRYVPTSPDLRSVQRGRNPGYPAARKCHSLVQVPESRLQPPEVYICGGFSKQDYFSDIWRLNLKTMQWTKCSMALSEPLYFHSTCLSPTGLMITFGGVVPRRDEEKDRVNDMHTCWLGIPKLSEMCWAAVLHYMPNIRAVSKGRLLAAGIPETFVRRIQ